MSFCFKIRAPSSERDNCSAVVAGRYPLQACNPRQTSTNVHVPLYMQQAPRTPKNAIISPPFLILFVRNREDLGRMCKDRKKKKKKHAVVSRRVCSLVNKRWVLLVQPWQGKESSSRQVCTRARSHGLQILQGCLHLFLKQVILLSLREQVVCQQNTLRNSSPFSCPLLTHLTFLLLQLPLN